tara:strand:+ start:137 stop:319 length:183 start_codon:yes stop_codon:yes gene_type:complete
MWVYILSERCENNYNYTVGFYNPDGKWEPESEHDNRNDAAKRVAWLNGSNIFLSPKEAEE